MKRHKSSRLVFGALFGGLIAAVTGWFLGASVPAAIGTGCALAAVAYGALSALKF